VDCDLRRPAQHEIFKVANVEGLTTMFLVRGGGPAGLSAAAHMEPPLQPTAVPNLAVLASGPTPPNPSELLGSARMDSILEELTRRADVVLLDSPPVMAVTDAAVLSAKVDGCLLVVGAGIAKRDHLKRARAALEAVHANVLGVVVNNVSPDDGAFIPY
jgi:non-specific protein-tyrosine kinase